MNNLNNLKQFENLKEMANKNNKVITISEITTVFPNCGEEMMMEICDYLDSVDIEIVDSIKQDTKDFKDEPTKELIDVNNCFIETKKTINSFNLYLQEIGEKPLLTVDDEKNLAKEYHFGVLAQAKLDKNENLSDKEIKELKIQANIGSLAKKDLIEANLRLVVYIAKSYQGRGLGLDDLIQEGNDGLVHACEKFDYTRGIKFSTYATYWIKQNILRAIQNKGRTIRIPNHVAESLRKFYTAKTKLKSTYNREPSVEELAVELNYSIEKVLELIDSSSKIDTLDRTVGDDEETSVSDLVKDDKTLSPLDKLLDEEKQNVLDDALNSLSERQLFIIRKRMGYDGKEYTLEEIGEMLGISRERVRQLLAKALETLRANPLVNEYYNPNYNSSLCD